MRASREKMKKMWYNYEDGSFFYYTHKISILYVPNYV